MIEKPGFERPCSGLGHPACAAGPRASEPCAGDHFDAALPEFLHQHLADTRIIDNALLRHAQGRDAADVRLNLAHLGTVYPAKSFETVGSAAIEQALQAGQFAFVGGDHEFAADVVGDGVFAAELHHLSDPGDSQPRFSGSGLVVQAAVQHAAIVTGLVAAHPVFLFEHADARVRKPFRQAICRG